MHHASWPDADGAAGGRRPAGARPAGTGEREDLALDVTADVLREVRKAKSEARRKMRAPVERVVVRDTAERLAALELGEGDLLQAGTIERLETVCRTRSSPSRSSWRRNPRVDEPRHDSDVLGDGRFTDGSRALQPPTRPGAIAGARSAGAEAGERNRRSKIGMRGGRGIVSRTRPSDRVPGVKRTLIAELRGEIGEQVRIRGWVHALRDQKRMQFMVVRDETGLAQVVLAKDGADQRAQRAHLVADRRVGGHGHRVGGGRRAREAGRPGVEARGPAGRLAGRAGGADRSRLGPGQADRLALSGPAPARPEADLRGADDDRARDAGVLAQRAVHRDPHAEVHGLGERVRAPSCSRSSTSTAPPTWPSRRSSTSRWRWPRASGACSR